MRLDKWLKIALVFKQRSKAVDAIDNNKIRVNGEIAKAAKTLKIGDKVSISRELGSYVYTILKLTEKNVSREQSREMYELVAPEDTGTESEKLAKRVERDQRKENRKDWNNMYDDKRKLRQIRSHKYKD